MPCFLTCAFLLTLYAISLQILEELPGIRLSRASLSAALLPVALVILAVLMLSAWSLGSWDEMLMLMTITVPAAAIYAGVKDFRSSSSSPVMTALFVLFLLIVSFITLLSRDGSGSTKVLFGLYRISRAIKAGSVFPLKHVAQNVLLFMPFGFFLCACLRDKRDVLLRAGVYALVFSAMIESFQYLLVIGECDLEDVIANVAGACAGLGVYRLFERIR